jgi:hypothetical protein
VSLSGGVRVEVSGVKPKQRINCIRRNSATGEEIAIKKSSYSCTPSALRRADQYYKARCANSGQQE